VNMGVFITQAVLGKSVWSLVVTVADYFCLITISVHGK